MDVISSFMADHERVTLQFSAGKDSAACLKLLRPWIDRVIVLWCNPGDPYRETIEYMGQIKASVPVFVEVQGTQREFVKQYGYPADSVPFIGNPYGRAAYRGTHKIVSIQECCGTNLWIPLSQATKQTMTTGVVRGERLTDQLRSIIENLDVFDGQQYLNPLSDWTDSDVLKFLGDDLPPSYRRGLSSSLDCRTCTAYLNHNPGRIRDLRHSEPEAFAEIRPVLLWLREQARDNFDNLCRG